MKQPLRSTKGFTLIELLTVIAIIGILASLIIPTVGMIQQQASIEKAKSNLRQLAQGYSAYAIGARIRNITEDTMGEWAGRLATSSDLWDARVYYIDIDPDIPNELPPSVGTSSDGTFANFSPNSDFIKQSVEVVANLPKKAGKSLPVAWSWGLETSGNWDPEASALSEEGGIMAMTDASVNYYEDGLDGPDGQGVLIDFITNEQTSNIQDAIGSSAEIVEPLSKS